MVIYVDIDGTICNSVKDITGAWSYKLSTPRQEQIIKINNLYDKGHEIVYWTARGSVTGVDWKGLTIEQLTRWGCKYTRIETQKKPAFDLFIDDKTKRIEEL
tara:strand:+ start:1437 stop:1742 length:306 start_codon:yes stop_codon:yes gene_type:complete